MEPTVIWPLWTLKAWKNLPQICDDRTGHRGWRIGWSPSPVPSSARVTSALSWTRCAPTLSTSRTGSRRLVTQWLRGKNASSVKQLQKNGWEWLHLTFKYLKVTWDVRLMSTITGFSKSMSRINFIKTPMIVWSIPGIDTVQPPHGVNEVVELDISIHYYVWHVYVHPKSPNC